MTPIEDRIRVGETILRDREADLARVEKEIERIVTFTGDEASARGLRPQLFGDRRDIAANVDRIREHLDQLRQQASSQGA